MFERNDYRIADVDPELWKAIALENRRQEDRIELIALR
jgi:glycine hydroxymethyltransferase